MTVPSNAAGHRNEGYFALAACLHRDRSDDGWRIVGQCGHGLAVIAGRIANFPASRQPFTRNRDQPCDLWRAWLWGGGFDRTLGK